METTPHISRVSGAATPSGHAADEVEEVALTGKEAVSVVTRAGSGYVRYAGLAVTRTCDDDTRDADGVFVFVRDLDDGQYYSAGWQPAGHAADEYSARLTPTLASFRRLDRGVRLEMDVCVSRVDDVEFRRVTIANESGRRRRLEVTSYLEWVLQHAADDAAHPAFSKLFVETQIIAHRQLIVARRRAREPRQEILVGAYWIANLQHADDAPTEFETSRMHFLGRGRSLRSPAALDVGRGLSGTAGPVLDPIASLRRTFSLAPDESAAIILALAARPDETELLSLVRSLADADVEQLFADAANPPACGSDGAERSTTSTRESRRGPASGAATFRIDSPPQFTLATPDFYSPLREPPAVEIDGGDRPPRSDLVFDNGLGGFSAAGDEYVIRLRPGADGRLCLPPLPWSHVVANPVAGFIATETGAGYAWTVNSRENRLTHWRNDPVRDPHSEALFLRDRDRRDYWSPTPGPAGPPVVHEVRYGMGYVEYEQTSAGLHQRVDSFVPADQPIKITRLVLRNLGLGTRRLDLFFYAELALGNGSREQARAFGRGSTKRPRASWPRIRRASFRRGWRSPRW